VSNSVLKGMRSGFPLSGAGLIGSTMQGQASNGSTVALRVNDIYALPSPNANVFAYVVEYQNTQGWQPLCAGANEALVLPGTWNYQTTRHQWDWNLMTLACRGATFGKCVELGYKSDLVLDTYHQACIRALRADYCGDGQSHTVDGTQINIFDKLGTQADTLPWNIEANWTPDGATCIDTARLASTLDGSESECIHTRANQVCSTSWSGSVLIRTEVNR